MFRIVTKLCADRFLLLGVLAVALHHALDVGGSGGREDRLMPLRGKMDNRINGSPEHLACLVENISDDIQNIPARFQRTL